jgi:hypothetical protein
MFQLSTFQNKNQKPWRKKSKAAEYPEKRIFSAFLLA